MISLVFSPQWFYGIDIIFEILAVIVTLIISLYSFRLYKFTHERSHKYFAVFFMAFAVSFLAKIATNFVLYYQNSVKTALEPMIVKYQLLSKSMFFFQTGYDIHRFLLLIGLLGIYWLVSKSQDNEHRWIISFLLLIITLFSFQTYFVFHLTAAILLGFIVKHFKNICDCVKKKTASHARLNLLAFTLLLFSQVVFIFTWLNTGIYVVAEVIQLAGFVTFLINMLLLVFGYGKKKN